MWCFHLSLRAYLKSIFDCHLAFWNMRNRALVGNFQRMGTLSGDPPKSSLLPSHPEPNFGLTMLPHTWDVLWKVGAFGLKTFCMELDGAQESPHWVPAHSGWGWGAWREDLWPSSGLCSGLAMGWWEQVGVSAGPGGQEHTEASQLVLGN